jgi:hypothetical protein
MTYLFFVHLTEYLVTFTSNLSKPQATYIGQFNIFIFLEFLLLKVAFTMKMVCLLKVLLLS